MDNLNLKLLNKELNSDSQGSKYFRLGSYHMKCGDFITARNEMELALSYHKESLPSTHPVLSEDLTILGTIYWNLYNIRFAHRYYFEALELDKQNFSHKHQKVIRNINNLGLINKTQGRFDQAIWLFDRALISSLYTNPDKSDFHSNLGLSLYEKELYTDAKKEMEKALLLDINSEKELKIARDLMYLGYVQKNIESPEKIINMINKAVEIYEANNRSNMVAICYTYIGDVSEDKNTKKQHYEKAIKIFQQLSDEYQLDIKAIKIRMKGL